MDPDNWTFFSFFDPLSLNISFIVNSLKTVVHRKSVSKKFPHTVKTNKSPYIQLKLLHSLVVSVYIYSRFFFHTQIPQRKPKRETIFNYWSIWFCLIYLLNYIKRKEKKREKSVYKNT